MELFIVHDGGKLRHRTTVQVLQEVADLGYERTPTGIISDATAQTIASWWSSPSEPLSTVLSTMGQVDRRMTRELFASDADYAASDVTARAALDALAVYLAHHIDAAPSSYRACACDDCPDLTVGIVGELCSREEECGCDVLAYPPGYRCPHDPARAANARD